jgi:hypothetical protein
MSFTNELLARSPLSKTDDIERDIGDLIQISHPALPSIHIVPNDDHPLPKGPMPDYVEHKEGVNQVGRLSAEAVVREYDAAVKEIEALGAELIEAAKQCEATVAGVSCDGQRDQAVGVKLSRGRQALLLADRGVFADNFRSSHSLRSAQEKDLSEFVVAQMRGSLS